MGSRRMTCRSCFNRSAGCRTQSLREFRGRDWGCISRAGLRKRRAGTSTSHHGSAKGVHSRFGCLDDVKGNAGESMPDGSHGMRLLLVDDDVDVATMYEMQLAAHGFQVITAHSGREALTRAGADAPDLIYLDLGLPEMHGFDVL